MCSPTPGPSIAAAASELPARLRRYLERVLPSGGPAPEKVRICHEGEMWQKPGARPLRFSSVEELDVASVAFSWRARFPVAPLVAMRVVDAYTEGEGLLRATLFGIPLQRQSGAETAIGQALRYLAELPWVPQALVANPQLAWRETAAGTVEVSTEVGPRRISVRFGFDAEGDISSASCDVRPGSFGAMPWGGEFGAYSAFGGVRIPTRADVYWQLGSTRFVYWSGAVRSYELLGAGQGRDDRHIS